MSKLLTKETGRHENLSVEHTTIELTPRIRLTHCIIQFLYSLNVAEHWGHYEIPPVTCLLQPDNLHNHNDLFHNVSEVLHTTQKTMITRINTRGCNNEGNPTNYSLRPKVLKIKGKVLLHMHS